MSTTREKLYELLLGTADTLYKWNERGWHDSETDTDFFDDVLDVVYLTEDSGEYRGVRICLALGEPTIYVNTHNFTIDALWWGDYACIGISHDLAESIDNYLINYFINMRSYA